MVIGEILGAKETVAYFGEGQQAAVKTALRVTVRQLAMSLSTLVKKKLSGPVLHVGVNGRLRRSITPRVKDRQDSISGIVGTNVVYARIHEFGGHTRPHDIRPRNARALFFNGRFAMVVHHPGSNFPERSFLRSALAEMTPEIRAELMLAIRGVLK